MTTNQAPAMNPAKAANQNLETNHSAVRTSAGDNRTAVVATIETASGGGHVDRGGRGRGIRSGSGPGGGATMCASRWGRFVSNVVVSRVRRGRPYHSRRR